MKKLKVFVILLFAMIIVSGCSCTSSMCSEDDLNAIKESISEKWNNDTEYKEKLREKAVLEENLKTEETINDYVKQNVDAKIEEEFKKHPKACLTTTDMVDPDTGATIKAKTWKNAWKEGLLEGLIVYPISWLLTSFTNLFGGNGVAQILSIIVTTILIKLLMLIFTFKSQIQTQKLQAIQPEMAAISNKLRDPNLSQAEKSRLSMKMMEIYKKNNINPFSSLIPTLVSMPIFLSVWSAVNQTLVIRTGDFLTLNLGQAVSTQVFDFNITAIILFILMTAAQIVSMKLPTILRNKQANYKNKDQIKEANKQMSMTTNIMLVMILITGFLLPSALAVYWTVGALFSIAQTFIFQNEKVKAKLYALGNRKKKAKVVQ